MSAYTGKKIFRERLRSMSRYETIMTDSQSRQDCGTTVHRKLQRREEHNRQDHVSQQQYDLVRDFLTGGLEKGISHRKPNAEKHWLLWENFILGGLFCLKATVVDTHGAFDLLLYRSTPIALLTAFLWFHQIPEVLLRHISIFPYLLLCPLAYLLSCLFSCPFLYLLLRLLLLLPVWSPVHHIL